MASDQNRSITFQDKVSPSRRLSDVSRPAASRPASGRNRPGHGLEPGESGLADVVGDEALQPAGVEDHQADIQCLQHDDRQGDQAERNQALQPAGQSDFIDCVAVEQGHDRVDQAEQKHLADQDRQLAPVGRAN